MFDGHVPAGHYFCLWVIGRRNALICLKILLQVVDNRVDKLLSLVANQSVQTAKAARNRVQKICH